MSSGTARSRGLDKIIPTVYVVFEAALVLVFLAAAGVAMYHLAIYVASSVGGGLEGFREKVIGMIDLAIYTLIFLDLARIIVASISTRRFSVEGVLEVGMLAVVREFIGVIGFEASLNRVLVLVTVFAAFFTAWLLSVRLARERR